MRSLSHTVDDPDLPVVDAVPRPMLAVVDRSVRRDIECRGITVYRADVIQLLDQYDVPNGTPFFVDADGSLERVRTLNDYLLEARRQRAYAHDALTSTHAPTLARLLTFVRARHGHVDLSATTREDLIAYAEERRPQLAPTSWNNELARIASYFRYATSRGWIGQDPIPRWGAKRRNTLTDRVTTVRRVRFLTEPQIRYFLNVGLRGDGAIPRTRPAYPSRDYALGLTLVSTGLRREEGALLLDSEIPTNEVFPANGVHTFVRIGKGERPRDVWITTELATIIEHYRINEREPLVKAAQTRLRAKRRAGELVVADRVVRSDSGDLNVHIGGKVVRADRLPNALRSHIAQIRPDGLIEPLALFLAEGGRAPALRTVNSLFNDAANRLAQLGPHPDAPPAHLDVTPHVMRHTFAVRTLAALMRRGRLSAGDPYALLASPVLTVQQLLGHADVTTTQRYLFAAERYTEDLPDALTEAIAAVVTHP